MTQREKGFTLFTALLSFILILVAGLLINTMITAERTSNEVVLEVEAQSRMQTVADLTRADALQVVNYGIRNAIEEYTQTPDNQYPYSARTQKWQDVIDHFSNFFFGESGGSILAGRIASNLQIIVQSGPRKIGNYTIEIKGGQEPELKRAIQNALNETIAAGNEYVHVVQCDADTPPHECVGTFYVDLDFSLIDDEDYEKLPSIHVLDESTGRRIVEPVIPKGRFRIYVPLRIFKALKYTHEIAQGELAGGGGLLSEDFHNQLGALGVGLCDAGACGYREEPFTVADEQIGPGRTAEPPAVGGNLCPAEQAGLGNFENFYPRQVPLICDSTASSLGLCALGETITTYDPAVGSSRAEAIATLTEGIIGESLSVALDGLEQSDDFRILDDSLNITVLSFGIPSKTISFEGVAGIPNTKSYCTKLTDTDVVIRFEETNEQYIVVDDRKPLKYEIRIVDSFSSDFEQEQCISYCLDSVGILDYIFGPPLASDAGVCPKTACAVPGSYDSNPGDGGGEGDGEGT
jgi:hypothetical protein